MRIDAYAEVDVGFLDVAVERGLRSLRFDVDAQHDLALWMPRLIRQVID
jgi:hypothetical protein